MSKQEFGEDTMFNEWDNEQLENKSYTQEIINEMVDESIYQACTNTAFYIKSYQKENSLPFAEFLNFGYINDFILNTGILR
jgi:hypothetical protein